MNERDALRFLASTLTGVGDDAAVIDGLVVSTDMLHEATDFPPGTTRYTAGWRSVGASLSDIAAMGANATAAVAVYASPALEKPELVSFIDGAIDVCATCGAEYVGGDLDTHQEFTVVSTVIGRTTAPVYRTGVDQTDVVCVTGTLGRSGAALALFEQERVGEANELFQFEPRVQAGTVLARFASAMMDSSDGLARSLHQLAEQNDCGFSLSRDSLPIDQTVLKIADDQDEILDLGVYFGEDFELVCTMPEESVPTAREQLSVPLSVIGTVTESGVTMDGTELPDHGYTHGSS